MPKLKKQSNRQLAAKQKEYARQSRTTTRLETNMPACPLPTFPFDFTKEQINCGNKFDKEIASIQWRTCVSCRASFPNMPLKRDNCTECHKTYEYTDPNTNDHSVGQNIAKIKKFSPENLMDVGEVPDALRDLTYIEQMLIAQVHPIISFYKIRGAQHAYRGNIINFKQNIQAYITKLPVHVSQLPAILIFAKKCPEGMIEFRVRAHKIRNALVWLKRHNIFYSNIVIDENNLASLPDDGSISTLLQSYRTDDSTEEDTDDDTGFNESFVPQNNIANHKKIVCQELNLPYPECDDVPINEFEADSGYMSKAFPCLFPHGNGDYTQTRPVRISHIEYFQYLMKYEDRRFALDPRFRYFALNTIMRHQVLAKGSLYEKNDAFGDMTLPEIQAELTHNDKAFNKLMVHLKDMRSTKPYWKQRCNDLLSMVDQLGKPTTFFTLSAADYHWPDLYRLLAPGVDPATLTMAQKRDLMHKNPQIVSYFFQERCYKFLKCVIQPLFKIKDFWFRFEWQSRGSGHIHGVLWHDDVPMYDENKWTSDIQQLLSKYFDQLCCAYNPTFEVGNTHPCDKRFSDIPLNEKELDLIHLINRVQRHTKHGAHCLKLDKTTNKFVCRFNFPKVIRETGVINDENGYMAYEPKRNDQYMQRYNGILSSVWRANIDFSPIVSLNAVLHYIAKYASKAETSSKQYSTTLREIVKNLPSNRNYKQLVTKLLLSIIGERDYAAQEIFHILLGWPLVRCSRTFTTLCIYDDTWKSFKPSSHSTIKRGKSLVEKYKERPDTLDDVSLLEFAQFYNVVKNKYAKSKTASIVNVFPKFQLTGELEDDEKYFKMQCILNIPFRNGFDEISSKAPPYTTWNEIFLSSDLQLHNHFDLPILDDTDESVLPGLDNETRTTIFETLSGLPIEISSQILGERLYDIQHKWSVENDKCPSVLQVQQFLKSYQKNAVLVPNTCAPTVHFSPDQNVILAQVDTQILTIQNGDGTNIIKRCIVQGKAGSGKSTVINAIRHRVNMTFGKGSIEVCAPTGSAAVNVSGSTIHSLLNIFGRYAPLKGKSAQNFQDALGSLKFLIIDEMSLIGARLLYQIEMRCRELFPDKNAPFGGLFVYFFGDYRQLPPTLDIAVYSAKANDEASTKGLLVFQSFQRHVELTTNHRQQEDQTFGNILERVACGTITPEDYALLQSRLKRNLNPEEFIPFETAIHLYPTNDLVEQKNNDILRARNQPIARILASNNPNIMTVSKTDTDLNLSPVLNLSIGCRVMLRCNLWVSGKLINGSLGTLKEIVYKEGNAPPELPLYVLVEFDAYDGPYIRDKCFPIVPITKSTKIGNTHYTRKQLPLLLGHAFTIHKAQGLTLNKVVIDISSDEKQLGRNYVALSRCRRLSDLVILNMGSHNSMNNIRQLSAFQSRQSFLAQFSA